MLANPCWKFFGEFVRWETAVGGPDPHMATVAKMSEGHTWAERVWRAGCYIGVYNVPTAQALWERWPWAEACEVAREPLAFEGWLREHWEGIATRRERRSVRRPEQLGRFLREYATWAENLGERPWYRSGADRDPYGRYEEAWGDCQTVYALGRYVALKLLEFLRRYCDAPIDLPDLRPRGGWSPREGLSLLYPEYLGELTGRDSETNLRLANSLTEEVKMRLAWDENLELDRYNLQVLLCDFKQSWTGRRQFPGRSLDSEIEYHRSVQQHWGLDDSMFSARAALFPSEALGEVQGWDHVRKELGHVLREWGYTWSDCIYSYTATSDLSNPVRWEEIGGRPSQRPAQG